MSVYSYECMPMSVCNMSVYMLMSVYNMSVYSYECLQYECVCL